MPRPLSWLPRIHAIRRSVSESVRSHYGRQDLERLFEVQPRSAQKLLELLPSVGLGRARYVERAALGDFLDRIQKADYVPDALTQYKKERTAPRRVLRELLPRDVPVADHTSLPSNVSASPGAITIHFTKMEELAGASPPSPTSLLMISRGLLSATNRWNRLKTAPMSGVTSRP